VTVAVTTTFEDLHDILVSDLYCSSQGIALEVHPAVHARRYGKCIQLPREPRGPQSELEQIHLVTGVEWLRERLIAVSVMANETKALGERKGRSASHAMRGQRVKSRTLEATKTSVKDAVHI
jgi:hypothetical protein